MKRKARHSNLLSIWLLVLGISAVSCNSGPANTQSETYRNLDHAGRLKFNQYLVSGSILYEQYCANCHKSDGKGLGQLIPPLAQSDFLKEYPELSIYLIKNGIKGEIIVNGIAYNQPMPANSNLSPSEIAQIMTYVRNSWGNDLGMISAAEVEKILSGPKP
jgi:cytochrome c551